MFIPLAPTTSTHSSPSPSTSPLDDGITTVKHYIYIHTNLNAREPMTQPRCTTAIGKTTSNANPTVSTPAPILTDTVQKSVDTAAEAIAYTQRSKINLYARTSEKNT